METLQIQTGEKRIAINGDPNRVIMFNPSDTRFAEKFYRLIGEFQERLTEYQARGNELSANKEVDAHGIPVNTLALLELQREACIYIREKIDSLFGEGTSDKAFGDAMELDLFEQFFNGVIPFIQRARADKIAKYTSPAATKRRKRVKS